MVLRLCAAAAALALLGTSCTGRQDCDSAAYYALEVYVQDTSGEPVCDAVVTATDVDFSAQLGVGPESPKCPYSGVAERAGTYIVTAERDGVIAIAPDVKVKKNACHVIPEKVTLTLAD